MYVGVDVGTSSVKAALIDDQSRSIAVSRVNVAVDRPHHLWAEQDMESVWRAVAATVREVSAGRDDIRLLAVTGQGDGAWLVDDRMQPSGPAILWNDGRAEAIVRSWWNDGVVARGFEIGGSITFPGLANAILAWLMEHDRERFDRSHRLLTCCGWVHARLTGELLADVSDASAPFFDPVAGGYSADLLDLYGLEEAERLLPPVVAGHVAALTATDVGLAPGVPVVLAPYDVATSAFGSGAVAPGDAAAVLGTTFLAGALTGLPRSGGEPTGSTIGLGVDNLHFRFLPALNGMEALGWVARLIGLSGVPELASLAATAEPGAHGVGMLPYFSPAGERAPFVDPGVRGGFWNLSLEHSSADVARAAIEGATMMLRDCLEAAGPRPKRLHVSGGGANSAEWCGLIADITGVETVRTGEPEVAAVGAVLAGRVAIGECRDLAAAARATAGNAESFAPHPEVFDLYTARFTELVERRDRDRGAR